VVKQVADVDAAAELMAAEFLPGVIVVAQAFPGQFSHPAIDRLRRLAPLARVLGLVGTWCEGEMRTGTPWPAVIRTCWHQWAPRCQRELRRLAEGQCSSWALPVTATDEERLLVDAGARSPRRQGLVVIDTWSAEMHAWLSAACRSRGFSTVWQRRSDSARTEGASAALFDRTCLSASAGGTENDAASLHRLVEQLYPTPVIAMLDFPRIADHRCALAAGAASVLSKPVAVEDLFWTLDFVCAAVSPR
jgi:CheY-like chemotaxis protein